MSALQPHALSLTALAEAVAGGSISAVEATRCYLDRIERFDRALGAYLHVDAGGALKQAADIDRQRSQGKALGPLAGVPIALKDNLCSRGMPTTCASRILAGYVPPYDAHVVERLRAAHAVLIGKLNMDEFAMGSSTENSAFFPARNPWDRERAPGGSSGGAACATAARLASATLGSDTGGSVRQPAAFCGVTAIKPSYGRVSRYGLVAFASSLDQVGPIARNVRDAARMLSVIAGHDPRDATSVPSPADDYELECGKDVKGMRVGVLRAAIDSCDPVMIEVVDAALARLTRLGCELVEVELPHAEHAIAVYYIVASAEASSNLARFDGMRYGLRVRGEDLRDTYTKTRQAGFGTEVKRRIMLGTFVLSSGYYDAYYLRAQKVRSLIRRDFVRAFERCDVLLTPTAPSAAFRIGEVKDPLSMYKQDIFTLPSALGGMAALSTPCGMAQGKLPLGLQLVAPELEEGRLIRLAYAFEQDLGWDRVPPDPPE
jgi:aspartyl-tRNA(Asn)/glutamyl-tRNA(Gln) amidotransferase subunit A